MSHVVSLIRIMAIEDRIDEEPDAVEGQLVEAAAAGDGLAFRKLVEPHLAMLHRIAWRASGSSAMAEDAVQETLALAYQRLAEGSYRHDLPFRAFLAGVAARSSHTLARSERRRRGREQGADAPDRPATPEEHVAGEHAAARIREALARMPDKRREAALLRLDAGLSYRDIAIALDSSEGSARVLVHTALKELKEMLSDLLQEQEAS